MFQSRKKTGNVNIKFQQNKEKLLQELSKRVKELQKHALNSGNFDISRNDDCALNLTFILEGIFLHGYHLSSGPSFFSKSSSGALPSPDFWDLLHPFTHNDVLHQLTHLSHITSNVGRCRAWLRLALNDGLLESYFHAILSDKKKIRNHYVPKAFLRDEEAVTIMMNHFLGLLELNFDLNYNTPSLNTWTVQSLQLAGIWESPSSTSGITDQSPQPLFFPNPTTPTDVLKQEVSSPSKETPKKDKSTVKKITKLPADITDVPSSPTTSPTIEQGTSVNKIDDMSVVIVEKNLDDSTPAEVHDLATPSKQPGSNMLGMASGWSSTFEAEPASSHSPTDNSEQEPAQSETKVIKHVTSFHGILTDYAIVGGKKYVSDEIDGSPTDKDDFEEIEKLDFLQEKSSGFEVIADPSTPNEDFLQEYTTGLLSLVNNIAREKGLDRQNYKCQGCSRPIGMIYGHYKVCSFDGSYYCFECHLDEEHVIPSKVVHNWDLSKYRVAQHVKLFLMQIEEDPLFHIDEVNPTLYNVVPKLTKAKQLRGQLQHMKGYITTCRTSMVAEDVKRRMWPREYLWDDIHQYSLLDLIQVDSGQLQHHLKKIISFCKKHVYGCEACSQKGFICEICKDSKIVYAFEVNDTAQCPRCKAVFHKQCKTERQCPRCLRRRSRRQIPDDAISGHEQTNTDLNSPF
ncbi:uncharacterized protein LOC114517923 [Dendronephthya gigantea]|uniref:uncharacterized protein LOC114517923 n=1 Tax=Dendronephthya gigantea TaxID=151771 RepID=UPI00106CE016|nr:uncharacterized protein LOC114517923 [Dendronephthya gigantea]XP_028393573.1 uncharacterized protein LOC114517923 [Dendronephthya gigantea]XP_028393574.1 uncharacterized protein LOC114517923 [Dendronephthya gigantea]XP_028393575.1 uncharacterized protein LOC114517923 [Dendronephthya gigantea]XP_028393576.1 uncharacterized protein LOC114517923 [Dendronephthya gigantea]